MKSASDIALQQLESHIVRIPTRKPQKLAISTETGDTLFLIQSGVYLVRAKWCDGRHQILLLLYPGDCMRSAAIPPLERVEIAAASEAGEIWRLRWSAALRLFDGDPNVARHTTDRLAEQTARLAIHNAIIAGLTGDERVAALMMELALRTGKETPRGIEFDMPLSRTDIAEYLALNADTVSRILSRMRSSGLVTPLARCRYICGSVEALARECPIGPAIRRMHEPASSLTLAV